MSQKSISWSELGQLTHAKQVKQFNFCMCEDMENRNDLPYADCPRNLVW